MLDYGQKIFVTLSPGFTHKNYTWLESLSREKHSSILETFVNYGCKKFYNIGPRTRLSPGRWRQVI
jgi:hypothetical protein